MEFKEIKMKRLEIKIINKVYTVDVLELEKNYVEFWLGNERNGYKMLMFGMEMEDKSDERLLNIIENNIIDYMSIYEEETEVK